MFIFAVTKMEHYLLRHDITKQSEVKQEHVGKIRDKKVSRTFKENKKLFYNELNSERKDNLHTAACTSAKPVSISEIIKKHDFFCGIITISSGSIIVF